MRLALCAAAVFACMGALVLRLGDFVNFSLYVVVGFKVFLMLVKTYGYRRNRHMNEWNGPMSPRLTHVIIIVLSFNSFDDLLAANESQEGGMFFSSSRAAMRVFHGCCENR